MATNTARMITLESVDAEKKFVVTEAVAMQSQTIRRLIEDEYNGNYIPQINVNSRILAKVIEYCTKHAGVAEKTADKPKQRKVGPVKLRRPTRCHLKMTSKAKKTEEGSTSHAKTPDTMSPEDHLKKWDTEFLNNNIAMLSDLILAAEYLNIKDLLDLTWEKAANMIKDKSPEELREMLGIQSDFTPEEEEKIRCENAWAFD